MGQVVEQTIQRDPALFAWILLPISIVMVLTGILRHYATILMNTAPKRPDPLAIRETQSLLRGINLRNHAYVLSPASFESRKAYFVDGYRSGKFLKDPESKGQPPANPMTDPGGMDQMMNAMKGNVAMIVPQTLIMSWINAFFSGFVIMKLPFPLTIRFKSMLQSGVQTRDLDVRWVSSLSWYFLNYFGLQSVFNYLLGSDNAANQMSGMGMPNAGAGMFQAGSDPHKTFIAEAENLEVLEHWWVLDGVEERLLKNLEAEMALDSTTKKMQ